MCRRFKCAAMCCAAPIDTPAEAFSAIPLIRRDAHTKMCASRPIQHSLILEDHLKVETMDLHINIQIVESVFCNGVSSCD